MEDKVEIKKMEDKVEIMRYPKMGKSEKRFFRIDQEQEDKSFFNIDQRKELFAKKEDDSMYGYLDFSSHPCGVPSTGWADFGDKVDSFATEPTKTERQTSRKATKQENDHVAVVNDRLISVFILTCSILAWCCAMFVPVWKIVDTSYLFRERDDPSLFDKISDYFSYDSRWPFAKAIDDGKDVYRIYFFIMPFVLSFFFVALKGLARPRRKLSFQRPQVLNLLRYQVLCDISVLDLLLIVTVLAYSALLLWARMKRSLVRGPRKLTFLYVDSKEPIEPVSWEGCEIMALTFGVLAIVFLGWFVLMPMGRRSILLEVLGVPWEVAIKYHRFLGWYTLVILITHLALYIAVWAYANGNAIYDPDGKLLRHMMLPRSCKDGSCDEETNRLHIEVMWGYGALFLAIIICVFSLNYVRRHHFEVFYYVHQMYRVLIVFTCFHYSKALLYLIPGLAMLLLDKTIRFLANFFSHRADTRIISMDVFELKVKKAKDCHLEAGQYVFVNVPSVSVLEWHPITVTWATKDELVVHIKTRGPGSWTQKVYDEVKAGRGLLHVRLDGYYGINQVDGKNLNKKKAVLLFSGGCGLTFPFSIATALCRQNPNVPVFFHWITRTRDEFESFEGLLHEANECFDNLSVMVWVTLHGQSGIDEELVFDHASSPMNPEQVNSQGMVRNGWRGYPAWPWGGSIHALISALSIFMATTGYVLARKNNAGDTLSPEPRYLLVNRFIEWFLCVLMAFILIGVCLGVSWRFNELSDGTHKSKNDPRAGDTSSSRYPRVNRFVQWILSAIMDSFYDVMCVGLRLIGPVYTSDDERNDTTSEETVSNSEQSNGRVQCISNTDGSDSESESDELGFAPIIAGIGDRPDIAGIFQVVESSHPTDVAVFACGPEAMVHEVNRECQKRLKARWTMSEEEWLW